MISLFYNQILGVLNSLFRLGFSETNHGFACTYCRIRFYLWQIHEVIDESNLK